MRRAGFTLIELLVVIAIIAVLASILFPVFSRARAKATATACLSNLKQIALATLMYASDYDGMIPCDDVNSGTIPWWTSPLEPGNGDWQNFLYPYIQNRQIYVCAGAGTVKEDGSDQRAYKSYVNGKWYDYYYAMNPCLRIVPLWCSVSGMDVNKGRFCSNNLNAVISPAEKYLMGDYPLVNGVYAIPNSFWSWWGVPDIFHILGVGDNHGPHNDGYNMAYCDGHVKWVSEASDILFYVKDGNYPPVTASDCNWRAPYHWFPLVEIAENPDGSEKWFGTCGGVSQSY